MEVRNDTFGGVLLTQTAATPRHGEKPNPQVKGRDNEETIGEIPEIPDESRF